MAKKTQVQQKVVTLNAADVAAELPQEEDFVAKLDQKRIEHQAQYTWVYQCEQNILR